MTSLAHWRLEASQTVALAWPLVLANLAQITLTTTDMIFMGRAGPDAIAAGTLGVNLYLAFFVVGFGISSATAPMFAQAIGRGCRVLRAEKKILLHGSFACLAYSLLAWAVLWNSEALLVLIGEPPDLAAAAASYLRPLQWSLLPSLWFLVLKNYMAAHERPLATLWATAVAILVNGILCWALLFGAWGAPRLGLAGAGIASTTAAIAQVLFLLVAIRRQPFFRKRKPFGRFGCLDLSGLTALLRIGLPASAAAGFEITAFSATALITGMLGPTALAAHAVALQVASITFMVPLGIGQAATIRVGLAAGAGDKVAVRTAGSLALLIGTTFMLVMSLTIVGMPSAVVDIFFDRSQGPEAHQLARRLLGIVAAFQIFDGLQSVGVGVLRGLKDTRVPMIIAAVGYWGVGLPTGVILAFGSDLGGAGLWAGLATGLAVVAMLIIRRWSKRAYSL